MLVLVLVVLSLVLMVLTVFFGDVDNIGIGGAVHSVGVGGDCSDSHDVFAVGDGRSSGESPPPF